MKQTNYVIIFAIIAIMVLYFKPKKEEKYCALCSGKV